MPNSAAGAPAQGHNRRVKVPEGKGLVLAFAMCFATPDKETSDAARIRTLRDIYPSCYPVGVAEFEAEAQGASPRPATPEMQNEVTLLTPHTQEEREGEEGGR